MKTLTPYNTISEVVIHRYSEKSHSEIFFKYSQVKLQVSLSLGKVVELQPELSLLGPHI